MTTSSSGTGKTTAEMQTAATFTAAGWDQSIWLLRDGYYPQLKMFNPATSAPVNSIVIDPATPATVYSAIDGTGIFKSIDSGATWTAATTQPANKRIKGLVIKPGDSGKLFAASHGGGLFKSVNSGVDWTPCANTNLTSLNVLSLKSDPGGKLFAGTGAGIFVSADSCATWIPMNSGLP